MSMGLLPRLRFRRGIMHALGGPWLRSTSIVHGRSRRQARIQLIHTFVAAEEVMVSDCILEKGEVPAYVDLQRAGRDAVRDAFHTPLAVFPAGGVKLVVEMSDAALKLGLVASESALQLRGQNEFEHDAYDRRKSTRNRREDWTIRCGLTERALAKVQDRLDDDFETNAAGGFDPGSKGVVRLLRIHRGPPWNQLQTSGDGFKQVNDPLMQGLFFAYDLQTVSQSTRKRRGSGVHFDGVTHDDEQSDRSPDHPSEQGARVTAANHVQRLPERFYMSENHMDAGQTSIKRTPFMCLSEFLEHIVEDVGVKRHSSAEFDAL